MFIQYNSEKSCRIFESLLQDFFQIFLNFLVLRALFGAFGEIGIRKVVKSIQTKEIFNLLTFSQIIINNRSCFVFVGWTHILNVRVRVFVYIVCIWDLVFEYGFEANDREKQNGRK